MKKVFEKIVSITLFLVSAVFVALILLMMFKPEYTESLNDQLVRILVYGFGGLFLLLSVLNIYAAFSGNAKIAAVLLFKSNGNATKASVRVVKMWVKKAAKQVVGAKITKVALSADENNDVCLKATIKVKSDKSMVSVVTEAKLAVQSTMQEVLGLRFAAVDFVLAGVKREFRLDSKTLAKAVDAELARMANEAEEKEKAISGTVKAMDDKEGSALTQEEIKAKSAAANGCTCAKIDCEQKEVEAPAMQQEESQTQDFAEVKEDEAESEISEEFAQTTAEKDMDNN